MASRCFLIYNRDGDRYSRIAWWTFSVDCHLERHVKVRKLARCIAVANRNTHQKKTCNISHRTQCTPCETGVVYNISLSCGKCYMGQTGRCINDTTREHAASLKGKAPLYSIKLGWAIYHLIAATANATQPSAASPSSQQTKTRMHERCWRQWRSKKMKKRASVKHLSSLPQKKNSISGVSRPLWIAGFCSLE